MQECRLPLANRRRRQDNIESWASAQVTYDQLVDSAIVNLRERGLKNNNRHRGMFVLPLRFPS